MRVRSTAPPGQNTHHQSPGSHATTPSPPRPAPSSDAQRLRVSSPAFVVAAKSTPCSQSPGVVRACPSAPSTAPPTSRQKPSSTRGSQSGGSPAKDGAWWGGRLGWCGYSTVAWDGVGRGNVMAQPVPTCSQPTPSRPIHQNHPPPSPPHPIPHHTTTTLLLGPLISFLILLRKPHLLFHLPFSAPQPLFCS